MSEPTGREIVPYRQQNPVTVRPSKRTRAAIAERGPASTVTARAAHNWFELLDYAMQQPFDFTLGEAATLVAVLGAVPVEPRKLDLVVQLLRDEVKTKSYDLANAFDAPTLYRELRALSHLRLLALWDACNRAQALRPSVPMGDTDLLLARVGLVRKRPMEAPEST